MSAITKCLFPVAGYGTRFLPATKAIPKEMLPVTCTAINPIWRGRGNECGYYDYGYGH